jgi:hypothetical protein
MNTAGQEPRAPREGDKSECLRGAYWCSDAPEAIAQVAQDVRAALDKLLTKVETSILREERRREESAIREAERQKQARVREEAKEARVIEREVLGCIERMVRKVEKHSDRDLESGQPFVDGRSGVKPGIQRPAIYRVHGIPCRDYLRSAMPSSLRNAEAEAAVRAARARLIAEQRVAAPRPKVPPVGYSWGAPDERGRPWTVICLQRSAPNGPE